MPDKPYQPVADGVAADFLADPWVGTASGPAQRFARHADGVPARFDAPRLTAAIVPPYPPLATAQPRRAISAPSVSAGR